VRTAGLIYQITFFGKFRKKGKFPAFQELAYFYISPHRTEKPWMPIDTNFTTFIVKFVVTP
jgi:hypothetical protein